MIDSMFVFRLGVLQKLCMIGLRLPINSREMDKTTLFCAHFRSAVVPYDYLKIKTRKENYAPGPGQEQGTMNEPKLSSVEDEGFK